MQFFSYQGLQGLGRPAFFHGAKKEELGTLSAAATVSFGLASIRNVGSWTSPINVVVDILPHSGATVALVTFSVAGGGCSDIPHGARYSVLGLTGSQLGKVGKTQG